MGIQELHILLYQQILELVVAIKVVVNMVVNGISTAHKQVQQVMLLSEQLHYNYLQYFFQNLIFDIVFENGH